MSTFTVNGRLVTAGKNQKLIVFLRDTLRLTSVKNGCSEGACGTCMVLVDGKAMKACVQQTDKLEGKAI
ncbi:MAG: 2Fe-2S iron-sulfur cluster-binding protein, partial [Clostridiaceae bacterium]